MIANYDSATNYSDTCCPTCNGTGTVTCGTECTAHYYQDSISFSTRIVKTIKELSIDEIKRTFWEWLHDKFPTLIFRMERYHDIRISRKKYSRKMLFCESGYLPNRLRKKKSN